MNLVLLNYLPTLRRLEREGHITLCAETGKKVGSPFGTCKAWYIQEYVSRSFTCSHGKNWRVKYQDGCFKPFVYEVR